MYTFSHALSMPKLDIEILKVNKESDNVYKIDAAIMNKGALNTSGSNLAKSLDKFKYIKIKLEGDIKVIGESKFEIDSLEGYEKKKLSFVVKAKKDNILKITAKSNRAGKVTKEVNLD
jgi:hypothetical protein